MGDVEEEMGLGLGEGEGRLTAQYYSALFYQESLWPTAANLTC